MTQVRLISCAVIVAALGAVQTRAQETPAEYQESLSVPGRQGDYKAGVLKVNVSRNDFKVTIANVSRNGRNRRTQIVHSSAVLFIPLLATYRHRGPCRNDPKF